MAKNNANAGSNSIFSNSSVSTSDSSKKCCTSCGTFNTPLWRRNDNRDLVCNACGLYQKANNSKRPEGLKKKSVSDSRSLLILNDSSNVGGNGFETMFFQWNYRKNGNQDSDAFNLSPNSLCATHPRKSQGCCKCGSPSDHYTRNICRQCFSIDGESTKNNPVPVSRHGRSASSDYFMPLHSALMPPRKRSFEPYLSRSSSLSDSSSSSLLVAEKLQHSTRNFGELISTDRIVRSRSFAPPNIPFTYQTEFQEANTASIQKSNLLDGDFSLPRLQSLQTMKKDERGSPVSMDRLKTDQTAKKDKDPVHHTFANAKEIRESKQESKKMSIAFILNF